MRIAFVITPNMLVTSFTNAYELLFAAIQAAKMQKRVNKIDTRRLDLHGHENNNYAQLAKVELIKVAPTPAVDQSGHAGAQPARIALHSGLSIAPDIGLTQESVDMVYLPALWRNPRPVIKQHPELIRWIRWQFEHGAIINSTGTGSCFLAEAGILDNKPATTHWYYFEQFAKDYPQVELKRQHFITTAGKIYCAGSVNALTDLTLHHVHRFFGREISDHLSRHFSHEVRQPFDQLNFTAEDTTNHPDELVLQAQLWMQNNLSKAAISIRELASLFGMSQRNFGRRFKSATKMTPVQYLQAKRLDAAKELLQSSNLSIKEIAYRVGYLDVSYFTKLFKDLSSITPKEYRTTMRANLFGN